MVNTMAEDGLVLGHLAKLASVHWRINDTLLLYFMNSCIHLFFPFSTKKEIKRNYSALENALYQRNFTGLDIATTRLAAF